MKYGDEVKVQHQVDRQPVLDDPMEAVDESVTDVEMDDIDHAPNIDVQRLMPPESLVQNRLELMEDSKPTQVQHEYRLVFWREVERTRARRELVLMIRNSSDDEESAEGSEDPPTPKRARIDEDGLIVEAFLAYAVSNNNNADLPTTYVQAMASDDAVKWRKAMGAELRSHKENRRWTLKPRGMIQRTIGSRWVFAKKRDRNGDVVRYKARTVVKDSSKSMASTYSKLILRSPT